MLGSSKKKEDFRKLIGKCVSVGGGFLLHEYNPIVTHIVIDPLNYYSNESHRHITINEI